MQKITLFKKFTKSFGKYKNGVKKEWICALLSCFVIPLVFSIAICGYMDKKIEEGNERNNYITMKYAEQNMRTVLLWNEQLCKDLVLNERVKNIGDLKGEVTVSQLYEISELSKELQKSVLLNNAVESTCIYFKDIDMIVSPTTCLESRPYYAAVYSDIFDSYEEWMSCITGSQNGFFGKTVRESGDQHLFYAMWWPKLHQENIFLLTEISGSSLEPDIFDTSMSSKGRFLILFNERVVYSYGEDVNFTGVNFEKTDKQNAFDINGEKYVIRNENTDINGVRLAHIIKKRDFNRNRRLIQLYTFLMFLCVVAVGILLIRYTSSKMYSSVKELVDCFDDEGESEINEFKYIMNNIGILKKDRELLQDISDKQYEIIKNQKLTELLHGYYSGPGVEETLSELGLNKSARYFTLLNIALFKNTGEEYLSNGIAEYVEKRLKNLFAGYGFGSVCVNSMKIKTFLISSDKEIDSAVQKSMQSLCDEMRQEKECMVLMVLSAPCSSILDIAGEYRNITMICKFDDIPKDTSVIDCSKIGNSASNYYYSMESEMKLLEYLKQGNEGKAVDLVERIFENNFGSGKIYKKSFAEFLIHDISATLVKFADNSDNEFVRLEGINVISMVCNCQDVDDMCRSVIELVRLCCSSVSQNEKKRKKKIICDVIKFVDENYADPNLNVSMIADKMQMYQNYVSAIFKKEMKTGLLEYINNYRIDKAAELLLQTDMAVEDISEAVGYNYRTFCRNFSKRFGMNAKRYREFHL